MKSTMRVAAGVLAILTFAGCRGAVEWRYYAPFRVIGQERAVSPVDPAEIHFAGVASKLHYISIVVDGVFFRNLPGTLGKDVAIGVELAGALEKSVKTVSEPASAQGRDGFLFFDRPFAIDPFLYRGVPLRLTFTFRDVTPAESTNLRGRLQGLGLIGGAAKLIPDAVEKLTAHATQFEAFLGKAHKDKLFTYTFSLYPSDMEGVRQDLVVTGGRHVFIGIPAAESPKTIRKVRPADIVYKLRLAGRRLEWRHDGKEYNDSPYVLISVIRYKRYPSEETPLRQAVKGVDRFVEQTNWKLARSNLANIGAALLEDKVLTQMERNLEVAWRDVREARINAGEAQTAGDKEGLLVALLKQVKLMGHIGKDFQQILEPFEVKDILFQVKRLSRQAEELGTELSKPTTDISNVTTVALGSIQPPVEAPTNPNLALKPPDVVKVEITKPEPFYTRWWFYALVGVAAAGVIAGTTAGVIYALPGDNKTLIPVRFKPGR